MATSCTEWTYDGHGSQPPTLCHFPDVIGGNPRVMNVNGWQFLSIFLLRGCINMTQVVSKACETFMKHLEISRTVAHCTLTLLQYPKAQPSRCSTWRWFSAWLSVLQCSKHRILGAERSASAHDTAPSWNSSMVVQQRIGKGQCTWPDGASSFGIFLGTFHE